MQGPAPAQAGANHLASSFAGKALGRTSWPPASHVSLQQRQQCPGLHQAKHHQQAKGGDPSPRPSTGGTPRALRPEPGSPRQGRGLTRVSPAKGTEVMEELGCLPHEGRLRVLGAFSLKQEDLTKLRKILSTCKNIWWEGAKTAEPRSSVVPSEGLGGNRHKLND